MFDICFKYFLFDCSNDNMMICTNLFFSYEISVLRNHSFLDLKLQIGQ